MFKEYIYLRNLSSSQSRQIKDFNNNPKIQYEQLTNCEICESKNISILFNNDRYGINQKTSICNECGFMFSNPRMTEISAEYFYNSDLYRSIYDGDDKSLDLNKMYQNTIIELKDYKPSIPKKPDFKYYYPNLYYDFINSEINDFESVLDIGCGPGKKLMDFNFIKKKTFGIEPSKTYHRVHRELGLNTRVGFIKDIKEKENYDLVMLNHVFEHLTNLKKYAHLLHNVTKKYLFIGVPGHITKLQSIQNAHNYYFSLNTLNYFFLNNKFKLIKIDYARDNEFIFALYKKSDEVVNIMYDKNSELKIVRNITIKYFFKYIIIKILKIIKIEKIVRNFYLKLNKILNTN